MSRPGSLDRQAVRKLRLLEAEKEQLREDQEALKLTEDQRESLLTSFSSVKTQFFDLDGLRWTRSALKKRAHSVQVQSRKPSSLAPNETSDALSPLTNTLASDPESWEDTIRPGSDLGALLSVYYSAESQTAKQLSSPCCDTTPQYITYSKSSPVARSPSPAPLEPPTPRPIPRERVSTPSLKRRLSSHEGTETPSVAKRPHTEAKHTSL